MAAFIPGASPPEVSMPIHLMVAIYFKFFSSLKRFYDIKKELICKIVSDSENGGYYVDLLMIAKYLERVGDHATNVAEWVEYSITGEHRKYKQ